MKVTLELILIVFVFATLALGEENKPRKAQSEMERNRGSATAGLIFGLAPASKATPAPEGELPPPPTFEKAAPELLDGPVVDFQD